MCRFPITPVEYLERNTKLNILKSIHQKQQKCKHKCPSSNLISVVLLSTKNCRPNDLMSGLPCCQLSLMLLCYLYLRNDHNLKYSWSKLVLLSRCLKNMYRSSSFSLWNDHSTTDDVCYDFVVFSRQLNGRSKIFCFNYFVPKE